MPPRLNIPPITRGCLILLTAQSALSAALRFRSWTNATDVLVVPYLTFVPSMSLVYPWTLFTTTFVESNIFTFIAAGLTLYHGGKYLERAWTSKEFAKFILIVSMLCNIFTFVTLYVFSVVTGNPIWTLTPIGGTTAPQVGFLVAFSQLIPSHTVTLFRGIISLRVPRLPLFYLLAITILTILPVYSFAHFLLAFNGFMVSWTYLRFYKPAFPDLDSEQSATLRGDASETFAFAEFFPEVTRPAIAGIADQSFNILVTLKICTPFSQADIQASRPEQAYMSRTTQGSSRAETERRRALALKALDQRLNAATSAAKAPQPPNMAQGNVSTQPSASQPAMTAPGNMLDETSYDLNDEKGSTQV